jgi:carboxyvinyl-carboxyphosphonate phosphorylmutase
MADRDRLASLGVRIALQGHMPFYAAIKAVYDTLKHLRDGGSPAALSDTTASGELLDIAMKRPDYARWQRDYLQ